METTTTIIAVGFGFFWFGFLLCALMTKSAKCNDEYEILMLSQLNKNLQIKVDKLEIELKKAKTERYA